MIALKDIAIALYALSKAKSFVLTVVLTLGVAIGTLTAMFNLNYQIFAAPLPYEAADKILVGSTKWFNTDGSVKFQRIMPVHTFKQLYQQAQTQQQEHALIGYPSATFTLRDLAHSPAVQVAYTTPGFMQIFQMPMRLGRSFSQDEDAGSFQPVAILSEHIWRRQYSADPAILGRKIQIGQHHFTVIGIAAAEFAEPLLQGPSRLNDVWLPWDFNPVRSRPGEMSYWHYYLTKLKDSDSQQSFVQTFGHQVEQIEQAAFPNQQGDRVEFQAEPLQQFLQGDAAQRTGWMLAGSLLFLLIATVNIINLLLSRTAAAQRQFSIRAALGAQSHHLRQYIFAELSCLMAGAAVVALLCAEGLYYLLRQYAGTLLPALNTLHFNLPALLFTLFTSVSLTLLFGISVSRNFNFDALQQHLQSSGKGTGSQIDNGTRQRLIAVQVALVTLLLISSCQILLQAVGQLRQSTGFASADRWQVSIDDVRPLPDRSLPFEVQRAELRQRKDELMQIRAELAKDPTVVAVSVSNFPPVSFEGVYAANSYLTDPANPQQRIDSRVVTTDEHYLPMFQIRLLQGRNFTPQEVATQAFVVIINQAFAEKLQPDGAVLGQKLHNAFGGPEFEIIGVTANHQLSDEWAAAEPNRSYIPRNLIAGSSLLVQVKPGMQINKSQLNQTIQQKVPYLRAAHVHSIGSNVDRVLLSNYLAAAVTSALLLLSFVLAAVGVYGVLSYNVQLRRFSLGVRMSIGARPLTILRQLLLENLKPVGIGFAGAFVLLAAFWSALQHSHLKIELSGGGFTLPILLIVLLTVLTTLLSVWRIIRNPAIYALQGH